MSTRKAATDARNFLHQFRHLVAFAESVQELGNIESLLEESRGLRTALIEELEVAKEEYNAARERVAEAKAELEQLRLEQQLKYEELTSATAKLRAKAKQEISEMKQTAQAAVEKARVSAKKEREAHDLWLLTSMQEKDELSTSLDDLKREMEALRKKLL